jgi:DNA-binding NtrC family response regulator
MQNYSWPGNVRELQNVIHRAIIMAEGEYIQAADLPLAIQEVEIAEEEADLRAGSFERLLRD